MNSVIVKKEKKKKEPKLSLLLCHNVILNASFSWKIALILTRWESSLCIMSQNFSIPSWLWWISNAGELIFITYKGNIEPRGGHNWSSLSPERPKLLLGLEVELGLGIQELLWREGPGILGCCHWFQGTISHSPFSTHQSRSGFLLPWRSVRRKHMMF